MSTTIDNPLAGKWTHGPWRVTKPGYIAAEETGKGIAVTVRPDEHPEDGPNAQLIAAAPDLYIALLAIEEYILQDANYPQNSFNRALHNAALEALATARGEVAP